MKKRHIATLTLVGLVSSYTGSFFITGVAVVATKKKSRAQSNDMGKLGKSANGNTGGGGSDGGVGHDRDAQQQQQRDHDAIAQKLNDSIRHEKESAKESAKNEKSDIERAMEKDQAGSGFTTKGPNEKAGFTTKGLDEKAGFTTKGLDEKAGFTTKGPNEKAGFTTKGEDGVGFTTKGEDKKEAIKVNGSTPTPTSKENTPMGDAQKKDEPKIKDAIVHHAPEGTVNNGPKEHKNNAGGDKKIQESKGSSVEKVKHVAGRSHSNHKSGKRGNKNRSGSRKDDHVLKTSQEPNIDKTHSELASMQTFEKWIASDGREIKPNELTIEKGAQEKEKKVEAGSDVITGEREGSSETKNIQPPHANGEQASSHKGGRTDAKDLGKYVKSLEKTGRWMQLKNKGTDARFALIKSYDGEIFLKKDPAADGSYMVVNAKGEQVARIETRPVRTV